ncbi:MAG TPA: DNA topoisomerase (ATP-hydrolyzing) subunit A [Clostridia bacterium]|nr:DNA topoisomerase (ATP-hydrolyzing) subunit A [Clostridia bacterium]
MTKKKKEDAAKPAAGGNAVIENAGIVLDQPITQTLTSNYMPYAMSVIVSRAIPEIDGFKPSHRKILYTMYKMGLLNGGRVKSANAVGEVMKLHPHGDQAIYETLVRLSRGNEALLHPYIDSKGNFGKAYSRDMAYAAARYTEVKLMTLCQELFADLDKDAVDMVDSYDGRMKEPTLLPVSFPSILVNSNVGIAVGMASSICPFNLAEVCETAIALIKNPEHIISDTLKAPDFPGGGQIIYNADELEKIYATGRGSVRVRSRYRVDKNSGCLEIVEIPPTTTVEAIIDKVVELVKSGKVREVADIRDETDLGGLKITLDLKRGVDADKLMKRLLKLTPLEDAFSCNFNVLIGSSPRVMGVGELLNEWTAFRLECIRRRLFFELRKKREKLHLLQGLAKILMDIDKAIKIVRGTEEEREVVPNLMIGFGIDEVQAEYVAEIKLRQLNREYILKRTEEIDDLKNSIADMEETLKSRSRMLGIITTELKAIVKKFGQPRKSEVIIDNDIEMTEAEEAAPDYPVNLFFTREGYFKKITPQSWRMSAEHKLKEGDEVVQAIEASNRSHLLFFSDKGQVYKAVASDFDDTKASVLGDYIAAKLGFDEGENAAYMAVTTDYKGYMLFGFENGKVAKITLASYETKTRRKKLTGAYSIKERLTGMLACEGDTTLLLKATNGKVLLLDTARIAAKTARDSIGVQAMTVKGKTVVSTMKAFEDGMLDNAHHYYSRSIPSAGYTPREEDIMTQITLEPQE